MLCALVKKKAVRRYGDLTVKVFLENSEITWSIKPQLRTLKSGFPLILAIFR